MKRRIIRLGKTAFTVTLPKKWLNSMNLLDKSEIDCEIRGNEIVFSADKESVSLVTSIDITPLSERAIRWLMSGLHKGGYDEIEIIYKNKHQLDIINELLKDLMMGFTILEQTERRIRIKIITKDTPEEFFPVLRRAFLVALSLADTGLSLIRDQKLDELKELIYLEKTNNQLTNYCQRIIHKGIFPENDNPYFLYVVIWNLEKIADDYKYIAQDLTGKSVKIKKEVIDLFEKVNHHFRAYYELFYDYDEKKLSELSERRKELQNVIKQLLETTKDEDTLIISYLYTILMKCEDFSASMFMLRHK